MEGSTNTDSGQKKKASPLRELMIEDMQERKFCQGTQSLYVRAVLKLVKH